MAIILKNIKWLLLSLSYARSISEGIVQPKTFSLFSQPHVFEKPSNLFSFFPTLKKIDEERRIIGFGFVLKKGKRYHKIIFT